jgi:hypothetical protein
MRWVLVLLVGASLFADPPFSTNIEISNDPYSSNQNETGFAVDHPYIYANWNDNRYGDWEVGYTRSVDGGSTFADDILLEDLYYGQDGDPVLQVGPDGTVYCLWLSFDSYTYYGRLVLLRSYDHGATWPDTTYPIGTPSGRLPDKPWFVVRGDTIYLVYADFNTSTWYAQIKFTKSVDGGNTFSSPIVLNGGPQNVGLPFITVDPQGSIYVIWFNSFLDDFYLAKSTDGGNSFTSPIFVHNVYFTTSYTWRAHPIPSLVAGGNDTLYLTWTDDRFGSWDILFSRSVDGGNTWSSPIKINDDVGTARQMMPMMAVDPGGGIHVAFYDRRTGYWDIRYSRSLDKGLSFEANLRVSDASFYGEYFMGDYMGIRADANYVYIVWSDGRDGNQDIYFSMASGLTSGVCGDANGDGAVTVADMTYLTAYLFAGGPPPVSPLDPNQDGIWDTSDLVYLAQYFYGGGPAPCE